VFEARVAHSRKGSKKAGANKGSKAKPQWGLGRQPQDFRPAGRIFKQKEARLCPFFTAAWFGWPKKATGSAHEKCAPSQTRHKNATEASQFDREVAEAKQGGGALAPAFKSRTTPCATPGPPPLRSAKSRELD
jgi:hypothetical protein